MTFFVDDYISVTTQGKIEKLENEWATLDTGVNIHLKPHPDLIIKLASPPFPTVFGSQIKARRVNSESADLFILNSKGWHLVSNLYGPYEARELKLISIEYVPDA